MVLRLDHIERVMMRMVIFLSAVSIAAAAKVRCNHTMVKRKAATNYAAAVKDGVLGPDVTIEQDTSVPSCSGTANALYVCGNGGGTLDETKQNNLITWTFPSTDYLSLGYKMEVSGKIVSDGSDEIKTAFVFTRDDDQLEYVGFDFPGSHKVFIAGVEFSGPTQVGSNVFPQNEWFNAQLSAVSEFIHNKDYMILKLFVNGKQELSKSFDWKADAVSLRPMKAELQLNYWMDVSNSVVEGQTVKLGDAGATACPAGFAPVLTARDCEAAMPNDAITYVDEATAPKGCFKTGTTLNFQLNPAATNSRGGDEMVCYGQEPTATDCAVEDMATITAVDTADVATITDRFAQMSSEITDLQQQVTDVDTEISEVEGLATQTASHFQDARTKIAQIKNVSDINADKSGALEAMAEKYTARVNNASTRLAEVQKTVKTLEEDALELGTQSSSMGDRVAALEDEVDKMLPGVGGIESRLGTSETQVANLRAEVSSGNLEDTIKTSLRGHFARATKHVNDLTDQVILEEAKKASESR